MISPSVFYLILFCYISLLAFHEFTCVYSSVTALSLTDHGVETVREREQITDDGLPCMHRLASSFGAGMSDYDGEKFIVSAIFLLIL